MLYLGWVRRKGAGRNGFLGKPFDLVLNRVGFISAYHSSVFRVHAVRLVSVGWLVVCSPPARGVPQPTLLERKSYLGDRRLVHGIVRYRRRSSGCLAIVLITYDKLSFTRDEKCQSLCSSSPVLTSRDRIEC